MLCAKANKSASVEFKFAFVPLNSKYGLCQKSNLYDGLYVELDCNMWLVPPDKSFHESTFVPDVIVTLFWLEASNHNTQFVNAVGSCIDGLVKSLRFVVSYLTLKVQLICFLLSDATLNATNPPVVTS